MKQPVDIETLTRQSLAEKEHSLTTRRELDRRVLAQASAAFESAYQNSSGIGSRIWSRWPTLKLVRVAAVVLIATVLGVFWGERLLPRAYAVEQTLAALEHVTTVHVVGTDWDGNRFEAWSRIDPVTGKTLWCCIDQTPHSYKIASRPDGSCVWDQEGQVVRYSSQPIASNDFRYTHVFDQIAQKMAELSDDERISIHEEKDAITGKSLIVIHVVTGLQDYRIYVDPSTKLPIRIYFDRADNMKQIAQSIDKIDYDCVLPDGMFDFVVPEKWKRDWSSLDDPANGLPIGELTHEQGVIKTARAYWQAVIQDNWDLAVRLRPVADWKTDYHKDRPVELISISQPRSERGCSGLVTPCLVRFVDGRTQKIELVINYRDIAGQASCIIVATWGWPEVLSE